VEFDIGERPKLQPELFYGINDPVMGSGTITVVGSPPGTVGGSGPIFPVGNLPPALTDVAPSLQTVTATSAPQSLDLNAVFTDPDLAFGDSLIFSDTFNGSHTLPAWLDLDPETGVIATGKRSKNSIQSRTK
jgi:hypothetical protein